MQHCSYLIFDACFWLLHCGDHTTIRVVVLRFGGKVETGREAVEPRDSLRTLRTSRYPIIRVGYLAWHRPPL